MKKMMRFLGLVLVLSLSFGSLVNAATLKGGEVIENGLEAGKDDRVLNVTGAGNKVNGPIKGFTGILLRQAIWGQPMLTANSINDGIFDLTVLTLSGISETKKGDSMDLVVSNDSLPELKETKKSFDYSFTPATGVKIEGHIDTVLQTSGKKLTCTVTANNLDRIIFGELAWKGSGDVLDLSKDLPGRSLAGVDVDTSNIAFPNMTTMKKGDKLVLVHEFGDTVGTITGDRFTYAGGKKEGKGKAYLGGDDLLFNVEKDGELKQHENTNGGSNDDDPGTPAQSHYIVKGAEVDNANAVEFTAAGNLRTAITNGIAADDDSYYRFRELQMNDKIMERGSQYRAEQGSTIITVFKEVLDTLPEGTNYLTAIFDDGSITIPFDLANVPPASSGTASKGAPKTGEI